MTTKNFQKRVDADLLDNVSKIYASLGTSVQKAFVMFLKKSEQGRGLPFELKETGYIDKDHNIHIDTRYNDTDMYIRTRDISEYNQETQDSVKEYMRNYAQNGISPSKQSVSDFFREVEEDVDV